MNSRLVNKELLKRYSLIVSILRDYELYRAKNFNGPQQIPKSLEYLSEHANVTVPKRDYREYLLLKELFSKIEEVI